MSREKGEKLLKERGKGRDKGSATEKRTQRHQRDSMHGAWRPHSSVSWASVRVTEEMVRGLGKGRAAAQYGGWLQPAGSCLGFHKCSLSPPPGSSLMLSFACEQGREGR